MKNSKKKLKKKLNKAMCEIDKLQRINKHLLNLLEVKNERVPQYVDQRDWADSSDHYGDTINGGWG